MKPTVALMLAALCIGSVSRADTLTSLYREALSSDPQFAAAQAQYTAVAERVPQARAGLLPTLTFSANSTANNNQNTTEIASYGQNYSSSGYAFNATLPLFRRQNNLAYGQSEQALEQARAQLELAHQDLIIRLGQAYFDVLLAHDSLNTIHAQGVAIGEQLAAAKRKFGIGTSTITDVADTQARFDLVTAQEIAATNDLEAKRQSLSVLVNREPGVLARLRTDVALAPPSPNGMQHWLGLAENAGMNVVANQLALNIARLEVKKARAADYPTLDLVASHGYSKSATTSTVGTNLRSSTMGLQLSVPLVSGGASSAHQREMAALLIKAEADLDSARRSGALSAKQAFLGVISAVAQNKALGQALDSARTALKSNQRGLEVGVRVNVDVLNAQQQLTMTERDLAKSRYDGLMATLRLKGAAGSLGEADVGEVNAMLETP